MQSPLPTPRARHAFTLIEMLVVVAIVAVMLGFAVPAVAPIFRGSQLTVATDEIAGLLNTGRQEALATDRTVEVRFYQFADPESPGESQANPATWRFHSAQLFQIDNQGVATALGKSQLLPARMIMDSGATLSTILTSPSLYKNTPSSSGTTCLVAFTTAPNNNDLQIPIPRAGTNYYAYAFRFARDGSTDLTRASPSTAAPTPVNWYITLHNETDGDQLTAPPTNYATVQVDPYNGSVRVYRP